MISIKHIILDSCNQENNCNNLQHASQCLNMNCEKRNPANSPTCHKHFDEKIDGAVWHDQMAMNTRQKKPEIIDILPPHSF